MAEQLTQEFLADLRQKAEIAGATGLMVFLQPAVLLALVDEVQRARGQGAQAVPPAGSEVMG